MLLAWAGMPKTSFRKNSDSPNFVKGSSFEEIRGEEVEAVMNKLNHRPRKTLNYDTPHAVFFHNNKREAA
ncbi:hypothetical protein BMR06_10835 [Methylococcaceae bacterium HT5]|nr:hypothetical protein BMR06_10835 [Methylococcaceae bacterium HT5]